LQAWVYKRHIGKEGRVTIMLRKAIDFLKVKAKQNLQAIQNEEIGSSEMVAIIVLIVIVLAVAVIFKDQIISAVNTVMTKLNTFISGS